MIGRATLLLLILSIFQARAQSDSQVRRLFHFVATDSEGQPVSDLRAEEIRVSDAGKNARVAFSRLVPLTLPSAPPIAAGEFSNRSGNDLLSSILILVDLFNTNFESESDAIHELTRTVTKLEPSNDVFFFILTPDGSLLAVRNFPVPGTPGQALTRDMVEQGLRAAEKRARTNVSDLFANAKLTQQTLETLSGNYAALPGQKRLIWMTRGMPLAISGPGRPQPLIYQTLILETAEEFRQLAIPVYTVHQKDKGSANFESSIALDSFASLTGGRNFENEAIEQAIGQAQLDARATYLAGFYTLADKSDGKVHELRVSTTRKGVRILAASNYTADVVDEDDKRALEQGESRIFDTPDMALRASVSLQSGTAHFRIYADKRAILLALVFFNADGSQTATEPVRSAVRAGEPITVDVPVPNGTKKVRIVAQDPATTVVGTLTIPLD
ncbi:MAG TPA: VWA domain-containing protein [Bryobacteraceae bacterium]|nr:VWA domain-containing protein [Bryobacteraceae bacterium]